MCDITSAYLYNMAAFVQTFIICVFSVTGTRRRKAIVPHDSTALLNQLRLEAQEREREERRQVVLERKQANEAFLQSLQDWEDGLVNATLRNQMKAMWEVRNRGSIV